MPHTFVFRLLSVVMLEHSPKTFLPAPEVGMSYQTHGGWLELICGSMFSGKTEELLRRIRRAEIARKKIQIFKPRLDNRYGLERVASHNGVARNDAVVVEDAHKILSQVEPDTEVVAVDEVQFFDWAIADVCSLLADQGKRVIMAGLDQDFRGEPFGPMPLLMALSERVDKFQAICVVCGASASRTQRLIDGRPARYDDPIILVGGSESYEARCRACHQVPGRPAGQIEEIDMVQVSSARHSPDDSG